MNKGFGIAALVLAIISIFIPVIGPWLTLIAALLAAFSYGNALGLGIAAIVIDLVKYLFPFAVNMDPRRNGVRRRGDARTGSCIPSMAMRTANRFWTRSTTLLLLLVGCSAAAGIPESVKNLVFEQSEFAEPVRIEVPGDETVTFQNTKRKYSNGSGGGMFGLLPVGIAHELRNTPDRLINFLVNHGYIEILTLKLHSPRGDRAYKFVGYTDKLEKALSNANTDSIPIARRKLESITYKNQYSAERGGVDIPIYALTFTYIFDPETSDFPDVVRSFTGKAKAYLDPDDGKWKLDGLSLEDDGAAEYL